ncbi:MAG: DinB family protein [Phycisphaeraceae bacterium]|nr:DinB family protein [Phycisphaerales bacterium]QOJ18870.1 MAG: DinB family protein [Phycisphaeraceae bacterium]
MTFAQMTLPEFQHEMATTRKLLERLPEDKLGWKAHPRSNTIGWNACHLAEIPGWAVNILTEPFYDMNPTGREPYKTPNLTSRKAILDLFDANVAASAKAIAGFKDSALMETWQFKDHGQVLLEMPRAVAFRTWIISHTIHHRAILSVYFRLNDIPVPAIYGPSGDEQG